MISRRALTVLVTAASILTVALAVVLAVARLLWAMHDTAGGEVMDRIGLAVGVLWLVNLVCLLLAQGINSLGPPSDSA